MKKILIVLLTFFVIFNFARSQNANVQFRTYLGTNSESQHYYGNAISFLTVAIAEDFGPRRLGADHYDWHSGIDYNSWQNDGDEDKGDLLLAIEGGTVSKYGIGLSGTKYIGIEGLTTNFVYVHIFEGGAIGASGMDTGGCTIKQMNGANNPPFAIIIKNNGNYNAIGSETGTVTFTDEMGTTQTITVNTTVNTGDGIAALGKSGATGAHLHLESMLALENGLNSPIKPWTDARGKNPFQYVSHEIPPEYEVELRYATNYTNNVTNTGLELVYPGNLKTHIIVRPSMSPVFVSGSANNRYNLANNLNVIELKIKSEYENNYELIAGNSYDSYIQLGGKINEYAYPTDIYFDGNNKDPFTHASLANEPLWIGNTMRTGVRPFIYAGGNNAEVYDDYYFADFITRIHRDDLMNEEAVWIAGCPQSARYNDGLYQIKARVSDIRDNIFEGPKTNEILTPIEFTLDNFKPFIQSVQVKIGIIDIYNKSWICNDLCVGGGGLAPNGPGAINANYNSILPTPMTINVATSEPMQDLNLTIGLESNSDVVEASLVDISPDQTSWTFELSSDDFNAMIDLTNDLETVQLIFTGEDFSIDPLLPGNQLLNLDESNYCTQIPTRTATGWTLPNFPQGQEEMHKFDIITCGQGESPPDGGNGNELPDGAQAIILNGSCVQIDIDSNYDPSGDGCAMQFYGSIISGDIVGTPEWLWDFGDGFVSTLQNPSHVYSETGNYTVTLTLSDSDSDGVVAAATQDISTTCNDTNTDNGDNGVPSGFLDCLISGANFAAAGSNISLTAMVSGGDPPYYYTWGTPISYYGETINTVGGTLNFAVDDFLNNGESLQFNVEITDSYGTTTDCDFTVTIGGTQLDFEVVVYEGVGDPGYRFFVAEVDNFMDVTFDAKCKFEFINMTTGATVSDANTGWAYFNYAYVFEPGIYQVTASILDQGAIYVSTAVFNVGNFTLPPAAPDFFISINAQYSTTQGVADAIDDGGNDIVHISDCGDFPTFSIINISPTFFNGISWAPEDVFLVEWSYKINDEAWINYGMRRYEILSNGHIIEDDVVAGFGSSIMSTFSPGDCISFKADICKADAFDQTICYNGGGSSSFQWDFIGACRIEIDPSAVEIEDVLVEQSEDLCSSYLEIQATCGNRIPSTLPSSDILDLPCAEETQYYLSYEWRAFSTFSPYDEIEEVEGIGKLLEHVVNVDDTQFKCIPINFDHPYFDLFEPNEPAEFICKVVVTDHSGTATMKQFPIFVNRPVDIDLPDEIRRCPGGSPLSLNPIAVNGQAPYAYDWLAGSNAITGDDDNPMISDLLVDGDEVEFDLEVTDDNGCTVRHQFKLIIQDLVVDIPEEMNFACAENTQFLPNPIVSGGSGEYTYEWTAYLDSDGLESFETDYLSDPNVLNPLITSITPPTTSGWEDFVIYYLTVTDVFGNCEATDNIQVKPGESSPLADAGEDQTVCYGTPITIGNPDNGLNDPIIEWTSSSSYFEGSNLPEAEISADVNRHGGMFNYTVSVTDPEFGCINTDMMQLSVLNVWLKEGFQYEDKYINTSISNPTSVPAWTNSANKIYTKDELPNSGAIGPFSRVWQLDDPISETIEAAGYPSQAYFDPSENQSLKLIVTDESTTCSETFKTNKYFFFGGDDPVAYMSTHLPSPLDCDSPIDICVKIVIDANFTGDIFPMNIEVDPTLDAPPPFADQNLDPIYLTLVDYEETLYEGELCLTVTPGSDDIMFTLSIDVVFDPENFSPPNVSPINDQISFYIPTDYDPVPSICHICGTDSDVTNKIIRAGELSAGEYPNQGDACQEAVDGCDKAWITNSTLIGKTKVVLTPPSDPMLSTLLRVVDPDEELLISRIYIDPCLVTEKSLLVNQSGKEEKEESKEKEKIKRNEVVVKNTTETTNEQKEIEESIPAKELSLSVFPNPFDEGLTLSYTISEDALKLSLSIHTPTGQLISELVIDEPHKKGRYSKDYSGRSLAPGMYFCELIVDDQKVVKKIIKIETK